MKKSYLTTTAIGAALILTGSTAMADISAADVWNDWKRAFVVYGQDGVSVGSETMSGDTLTISDVVLSIQDDFSKTSVDMGDIVLKELGDGTVRATMADTMVMTMDSEDGDVSAKVVVTQDGADILVSGDPDALTYDMSVAKYTVVVEELKGDGEELDGDIQMTMNNVAGTYLSETSDVHSIKYDLTASSLDMLFDLVIPDEPGDSFTFSGKIQDLATKVDMTLPVDLVIENPMDLYANGMAASGTYTFKNGAYIFDAISEGEQMAGSVSTGAGQIDFGIDHQSFNYNSLTDKVAMTIQGAEIPFPVEVNMAQYGTGLEMPFAKTEEPTDFGLRLNMTDLTVSDMIWMMIDPAAQLPRDPATLILDLSGKVKLMFDMMDPEQAEMLDSKGAQPGELHAMTLNAFKLALAGAEVTGSGAFEFDNSDLTTFDGMPAPSGDATVNIKGANGLIDKLVGMGLLPEDQAMMGRMMMGMFARTTGDDELTTKIEINDQGHVIANGQRIK